MKILLIGATGFTGSYVVNLLVENGHEVTCLARKTSVTSKLNDKVTVKYGDLSDLDSLVSAADGNEAIIHIANLGRGFVANIINACKETGIKRLIFTGSTGIFTKLTPSVKEVKLEAEELIKNSGLEYTIIRPTMIYGADRDRNMCRLVRYIKKFNVLPVLGNGEFLQQPVYVEDLAKSYILSIENPKSINEAFNIAGGEPLTYNQVVDITANKLNKKIIKLHIPLPFCLTLLGLYEKIVKRPKFTKEQAMRLNENKDFSIDKAKNLLGYEAVNFKIGIEKEINQMF